MAAKKQKPAKKGGKARDAPPVTPEHAVPEAPLAEEGDGTKTTPGRHRGGKGFAKGFAF